MTSCLWFHCNIEIQWWVYIYIIIWNHLLQSAIKYYGPKKCLNVFIIYLFYYIAVIYSSFYLFSFNFCYTIVCTLFCTMFHHFKTNGFVVIFKRLYAVFGFASNVLQLLCIIKLFVNKDWFVESKFCYFCYFSYWNLTLKGCIQHIWEEKKKHLGKINAEHVHIGQY